MSQRYNAFITYNHADETIARWLHARLERFVVPRHLRTTQTNKTLAPIFRDRDELTAAGELNETLENAIECSDALIVICSPASAASPWVNTEIDLFRQSHPTAPIACVIVDGEPGDPARECFPEALNDPTGLRRQDRISADLRAGKDTKHDALLRVAAALLDVSFDALKQRHQRRRIRVLLTANALGSIVIVALATLAWVAYQASQDAARRQAQAEELVGFMLGDLRTRLEPIGRLDVLDALGDETSDYFASLEDTDETSTVLLSRAKAMRQLGDIRMRQGRLTEAAQAFTQALTQNEQLYQRAPLDATRLFELAQAEFWVGYAFRRNADGASALIHMQRYLKHANTLVQLKPDKAEYVLEIGYANNNLGTLSTDLGNLAAANKYFTAAESSIRILIAQNPKDTTLLSELGQVLSWRGINALARGLLDEAISHFSEQELLLRVLANKQLNNKPRQRRLAVSLLLHGEVLALAGRTQLALDKFSEAHHVMADLVTHDSANRDWQRNAARALWYLGRIVEQQGDLAGAIQYYEEALETFSVLVEQDKQQARWQRDFAESAATLLRAYRNNNDHANVRALAQSIEQRDVKASLRLSCELALARGDGDSCGAYVTLAEEAVALRSDTASYITLYSVLHAQDDPRQEDAWKKLSDRGISSRDSVNTL